MGRPGFVETQFVCAICGARFKALAGPNPPATTFCGDCGLRHSPEKLRQLAAAKKAKKR
jgi:transcription elongation factor Elf1